MGAVDRTIEIIFAGVDNVSGVITDISGNIESMGSNLEDISAPFTEATKAIGIMQIAVVGLLAAGVNMSAGLEKEVTKMVASLGLLPEEAKKFEDIAKEVYSKGYGDDLAASFEVVTLAQKKFGDNAEVDIGKVVENAAKLEKVFGVDMQSSMGAVSTLMNNFGITAEEAFDFIAKGYQKGLDGSGDFLESINEYSTQFANGGVNASGFFSVLETGFQEGMLGTDRAADAFKEFRVRIQDGSKTTADALKLIGIDPEALQANLNSGVMTVNDAFGLVIKKLNETKDSSVIMQAGVGLIGTQFEDLGTKAALALNTTSTSMDDLKGTINDIDVGDFGTKLTAAWRSSVTALISDPMWDNLKSGIVDISEDVSENFIVAFKDYDFKDIIAQFEDLFGEIGSIFTENDIDLTTIDGMKNAIELVVGSFESLISVTKGQIEVIKPIITFFLDLISAFNKLDPATKEVIGSITTIGAALGTVGGVMAVGGIFGSAISGAVALLTGPVGLAVALGAVAVKLTTVFSDFKPMPDEYFTKPKDLLTEFAESIELFPDEIKTKLTAAVDSGADTQEVMAIIAEGETAVDKHFTAVFGEEGLTEIEEDLYAIPDEKPVMVKVNGEWVELDQLEAKIEEFEGEQIKLGVAIDQKELEKATDTITYWVENPDGSMKEISIEVDPSGVDEAKKKIEEIPTEKMLEIKMQGEIDTTIAKITSQAETAQAAFEWKAKLDIAEVEAQVRIVESAYDSINVAIQSTGDLMATALGTIDSDDFQTKWAALDVLRDEAELRQKSFDLQEKLTNSQIEYMNAKTKALESGESIITIDSTGLEPALEMVMWEIIQKVQVRATAEASEFLLGM